MQWHRTEGSEEVFEINAAILLNFIIEKVVIILAAIGAGAMRGFFTGALVYIALSLLYLPFRVEEPEK